MPTVVRKLLELIRFSHTIFALLRHHLPLDAERERLYGRDAVKLPAVNVERLD